MSELDSSLCQLDWLVAKNGIGKEPTPKPPAHQPLHISIPQSPPEPTKGRKLYSGPDKPPYSYSQLIRLAIEDTEDKKCTLSGIYSYISTNFEFYRLNRNSSWKNSIRHNLSLNKQFSRIDRVDGERRGWWVCVEPPEKKQRVLKGSPVRVNPIYEEMFRKYQQQAEEEEVYSDKTTVINGETYITELSGDVHELTEQEVLNMNLFESYDLNSSFRDVYNQIFEKGREKTANHQKAQIDWLKISLETAGLDYKDEKEMAEVDTVKLREYVQNGFPADCDSDASTPRTDSSRHSSSDSSTVQPSQDDLVDDDFDWNKLL